ncbi:MAG: putative signal transducing protein [Gemmatimonadota bacterium]
MTEGWAEVARTANDLEAELLAGSLRAADLDAAILSQKDHANVVSIGGLSVVRVLVPAHSYEAARAALSAHPPTDRERRTEP